MFALARENVEAGFDALITAKTDGLDAFEKREERIDRYNYEISLKITKLSSAELGATEAATLSSYFRVIGNVERIGDHAMNLAGYAALALEKGFAFSDESRREMAAMKEECLTALNLLLSAREGNEDVLAAVERYEESNDRAVDTAREALLRRVHEGGESADTAVLYSEYLSDYERIGDHLLNIAQEYDARQTNEPAAALAATPAEA